MEMLASVSKSTYDCYYVVSPYGSAYGSAYRNAFRPHVKALDRGRFCWNPVTDNHSWFGR